VAIPHNGKIVNRKITVDRRQGEGRTARRAERVSDPAVEIDPDLVPGMAAIAPVGAAVNSQGRKSLVWLKTTRSPGRATLFRSIPWGVLLFWHCVALNRA